MVKIQLWSGSTSLLYSFFALSLLRICCFLIQICRLLSICVALLKLNMNMCVLLQVLYFLQSVHGHSQRNRAAGLVQRLLHFVLRHPPAVHRSGRKLWENTADFSFLSFSLISFTTMTTKWQQKWNIHSCQIAWKRVQGDKGHPHTRRWEAVNGQLNASHVSVTLTHKCYRHPNIY